MFDPFIAHNTYVNDEHDFKFVYRQTVFIVILSKFLVTYVHMS